ncbi:MAG: Crp/Fnr family transcriptional regulator [Acinetobacter sp.]|nr:MAG: Crp/Fnr family transcriptional regulator [Acinetobacter sp.]
MDQNLLERLSHMPNCRKEIKMLFSDQFQPLVFKKGQIIISPYILNQSLYYVVNGLLRRYPFQMGVLKTNQLYINGDFISQSGLHLKTPNLEYIDCITDVQLVSINYKQLERFFRKYPEAIKLLICIMEIQKLKEIKNCEMLHIEAALERYEFASTIIGKHIHELPRQLLASYLRISGKQLGRSLNELARRK